MARKVHTHTHLPEKRRDFTAFDSRGLTSRLAPRQVRSAFNDPPGNPYLMGQLSQRVQVQQHKHFIKNWSQRFVAKLSVGAG